MKKQGEGSSGQTASLSLPVFFRSCTISRSPYTLPSSVSRKSCLCHSYENCRGGYQQFPTWNDSSSVVQLSTFDCQPPPCLSSSHKSRVTSLATLLLPWLANDLANTFSPISTGAKRSRAPF